MTGNKAMSKFFIYMGLALIGFTQGCKLESVDYPPEPQIEFKTLTVIDTVDLNGNKTQLNKIHFYLIDGDGNIGETPCYNGEMVLGGNCLLERYYFENNSYKKDAGYTDTIFCSESIFSVENVTAWYNIPYVGQLGQDKALKADIYIDIEYTSDLQKSYTNFFYKITVFDMDVNRSNTISTDTLILK
jgi:hypothetical protein